MKSEKSPSSLTLSAFSFVLDEAGGRMERIVTRVWRVMQDAFANIFLSSYGVCCGYFVYAGWWWLW